MSGKFAVDLVVFLSMGRKFELVQKKIDTENFGTVIWRACRVRHLFGKVVIMEHALVSLSADREAVSITDSNSVMRYGRARTEGMSGPKGGWFAGGQWDVLSDVQFSRRRLLATTA